MVELLLRDGVEVRAELGKDSNLSVLCESFVVLATLFVALFCAAEPTRVTAVVAESLMAAPV